MPPRLSNQAGQRKQNTQWSTIVLVLLGLIILLGLVILIVWLVLKPKKLEYSIDEASIDGYDLAKDHLNSTFNLVVRTYNPNRRASAYYDSLEVAVTYGNQTVAYQEVQQFVQRHRNVTRLRVSPTARYVALPEKTARDMSLERKTGQLQVSVRVKARITFKVGLWKYRHHKLRVFCSPLVIYFSSPAKFQWTNCTVTIK
ncbi:hypothetical protein Nepgr_009146 [Nepenthes gracilis]|uniref:Late embryogenesis abundant protein LEA-2 subgroup domain-containing protein n=1 Tax=Nepenthes gracilis TaxID=150966 RepID=A0AAD3XK49_NEPGR|nr:hypothetical protein Nepgr_009146 [Nepenthes gracilis]